MSEKKVVAFGEILMRLAAADGHGIKDAAAFDVCYGGTEANVLACLSRFGYRTSYLTALPDNELGRAAQAHLRRLGVDDSHTVMKGDTMGMYFVENGTGSRGANVLYNRRFSEITRICEDDFDYDKIFADAAIFHISGISFALSESCTRLAFRLLREARPRGVAVSFDFNYRSKLWDTAAAGEQFRQIVNDADILLASPLDLSVFFQTDAAGFLKKYPAKYLFLRDRKPLSSNEHCVQVTAYHGGEEYVSPKVTFGVTEKIGGGDAFDGGILRGILRGDSLKETVRFAIGAFALKHQIAGDTFTGTAAEVADMCKSLGI